MTFTEYWYGDVMERIYTTNTDFRGKNTDTYFQLTDRMGFLGLYR
jgi:hypothetical protein